MPPRDRRGLLIFAGDVPPQPHARDPGSPRHGRRCSASRTEWPVVGRGPHV